MKTSNIAACAPCRSPQGALARLAQRAGLVLLFAGVLPAGAWAQGPAMIDDLTGHPPELRRAELRRALSSGADAPVAVTDRRRLSPEERDALHRDLRNAMRGAYRDNDKRGREPN